MWNEGLEVATTRTIPGILIFSDNPEGMARSAEAVSIIGGRTLAKEPIDTALSRLEFQAGMDAVMVDVCHDHGIILDQLLGRLDHFSAVNSMPTVISAPIELIDAVCARITHTGVSILCNASPADRISALLMALNIENSSVHEAATEVDALRLRRLADEVSRIARALSSLSGNGTEASYTSELLGSVQDVQIGYRAEPMFEPEKLEMPAADAIRGVIRVRRLRDKFFDASLFADPAWDMLLDLLAAKVEQHKVAVSSLCIAAAVPPTTALRWIKAMTDHGLFERDADPNDGRRIFIRLSEKASRGMARYFSAVKRIGGNAV